MQLSAIRVYPIKSLRGVAAREARAGSMGLERDRRWMLVDEDGRFVSQREIPTLARWSVELLADGCRVSRDGDALFVPRSHEGPRVRVRVWRSEVGVVVHQEGSAFFSAHLGRALRLVWLPDDEVRAADRHARPGDRVSLADAYPYLLVGQGSLDGLNARLGEDAAVPMSRFRPNLVVAGSEAHAEDGWRRVRIGEVTFLGVTRCSRCVMTTVDPVTGDTGVEPLRTLARYRREPDENGREKVWFGVNLVAEQEGRVRVGDEVVVEQA